MAKTPTMKLRTVDDLRDAHEWMFNKQKDGELDAKSVDGMNTTLKGAIFLNVTVPMKWIDIFVKSQIKKIEIPPIMLPEGMRPKA